MRIAFKLCMTKDVGVGGNLFGGNMLAWMDETAAIYARLVTGERFMVTKRFDEVVFSSPVKVGDIVEFFCNDPLIGNTSVTFSINANVGDKLVFSTKCTFVAVDENGCKKEIINKVPLMI